MCSVAWAGFALAAASAVGQVVSGRKAADAQEVANQQQYDHQMGVYRTNLANIEVARSEALSDATQKLTENNKAARAAQASATVSAGEGGVSGTSVDALLRDLAGQAGYDNTNVEENYLRQNQVMNARRENAFNSTVSDINGLLTPQMPDYLGAGLRIGQAGLNAYSEQQRQDAIRRGERG
jgi:hypothetical protein